MPSHFILHRIQLKGFQSDEEEETRPVLLVPPDALPKEEEPVVEFIDKQTAVKILI